MRGNVSICPQTHRADLPLSPAFAVVAYFHRMRCPIILAILEEPRVSPIAILVLCRDTCCDSASLRRRLRGREEKSSDELAKYSKRRISSQQIEM